MAILVCRYCKSDGEITKLTYRSRKTYASVKCCCCAKEWVVGGFPGRLTEDDVRQINEKQTYNPQMHKHEPNPKPKPQPTAMALAIAKALDKEN